MRELSLFSGGGGGLLASRLLGWDTCGYVEWDPYCQQLLAVRIRDGLLPVAPIFGDIRTFVGDGYAAAYQGLVDVVSGGFPCQPFSIAGKQGGADDARNMWPATLDVLRAVRPRYAFLENVPGLLTSGYFGTVLRGLAEERFSVAWCVLGAGDVGAPHRRKRLWLLAVAEPGSHRCGGGDGEPLGERGGCGATLAGAQTGEAVAYPYESERRASRRILGGAVPGGESPAPGRISWWDRDPADRAPCGAVEPLMGRVVDGMAHRVDRLRALGNGQVPAVAATAWRLLYERLVYT